jgi:hypothetical protein
MLFFNSRTVRCPQWLAVLESGLLIFARYAAVWRPFAGNLHGLKGELITSLRLFPL